MPVKLRAMHKMCCLLPVCLVLDFLLLLLFVILKEYSTREDASFVVESKVKIGK